MATSIGLYVVVAVNPVIGDGSGVEVHDVSNDAGQKDSRKELRKGAFAGLVGADGLDDGIAVEVGDILRAGRDRSAQLYDRPSVGAVDALRGGKGPFVRVDAGAMKHRSEDRKAPNFGLNGERVLLRRVKVFDCRAHSGVLRSLGMQELECPFGRHSLPIRRIPSTEKISTNEETARPTGPRGYLDS